MWSPAEAASCWSPPGQEKEHPQADVMFGGGVDSLAACRDCFEPYFCAGQEEILPQYRVGGRPVDPLLLPAGGADL